ncbi:tripartite tricarboxylate transporter TctB family protein [Aestuariibius sp. HNIBRBA575]|uniref:tripartite tricarboxylate transporter TctB family protein n=1 Tax=Aestuariibius sp. HNIBRBA575 TaxID=3233343 RepID=UPI0034A25533
MGTDRTFGLVVTLTALAYIASATQIQTSFLTDPVGPRMFPMLIGCVAVICGVVVMVRPDPNPDWPAMRTFGSLLVAVVVLIAYAYSLKPLGFLFPTAITAAILSYQINPHAGRSIAAGIGLSAGLFLIFKFALGLGLVAFPKGLIG